VAGARLVTSGRPVRPALLLARRPTRRSTRLTVLFRLLLALPHLAVLYALTIATEVVTVISWVVALFTGRVPDGLYGFVEWVVRYGTRVNAYVHLLTDTWPGFSDSTPYPVTVHLERPDRLNRLAVLFRIVLLVPAGLLGMLLVYGQVLVLPFVWLVTLLLGRVPTPAFDGLASAVRWQTRYYAYALLLTSAYPAGLLGDEPDRTPVPEGEADVDTPVPPRLAGGGRGFVAALVALGALAIAGAVTLAVVLGDRADPARADAELGRAFRAITVVDSRRCAQAPDPLGCLQSTARDNLREFRRFLADLDEIDFPSDVDAEVDAVRSHVRRFCADLAEMAAATDLRAFQRVVDTSGVAKDSQRAYEGVQTLHRALQEKSR
jgi:hypothetical protein